MLRDRFGILQRDSLQRDMQRSNRPEEPGTDQEGKRTPNSKTAKGAEEERGSTKVSAKACLFMLRLHYF